jgi:NAD(P)-dependent dehydrogenase (short-subunit alcohol dehydrogenase family)
MRMMRGIENKVVIVSGGAASIGAEIVDMFVAHGAAAVIADVDVESGGASREPHEKRMSMRTDLASDDDIRACVQATVDRFGRIDFIVNAAALYEDEGAASDRMAWARSFDVNVTGPAMLVLAARPHLAAANGAVVNIGSISASVAQAGRWTYPASKAALAQVTRSMALDLSRDAIRVNSVSPGWTWSTGMERLGLTREAVDRIAAPFHFPGRAGERSEVADAVLFLCSDHARFISGADLPVDGGYRAMGPEGRESAFAALVEAIPAR